MAAAEKILSEDPGPVPPKPGYFTVGLRFWQGGSMLFFYLVATENAPILGGNWSGFATPFAVYILIFLIGAIVELTVEPTGRGNRFKLAAPEEEARGAVANFAFWTGSIGFLSTVGAVAALHFFSLGVGVLTGQERINLLVYVLVFVAPTEEYFFRAVLSNRLGRRGWLWGSVVGFAFFHLAAYSVATGGVNLSTLSDLLVAALLGWVFWIVYDNRRPNGTRRMGLGGSVPLHAVYDLVTYGVIGGTVTVAGIPLIPLALSLPHP